MILRVARECYTYLIHRTLLPPATKLGQGYVFTGVCDSVHRGVSASVHAGIHTPPAGSSHPLGADTPFPPKQTTPCGADPLRSRPPGSRPPWSRHPPCQKKIPPLPGEDTRLGADTPQSRHPPGADTPLGGRHLPGSRHPPPHRVCWEIQSMRGRYASYWNAIVCSIHVSVVKTINVACFNWNTPSEDIFSQRFSFNMIPRCNGRHSSDRLIHEWVVCNFNYSVQLTMKPDMPCNRIGSCFTEGTHCRIWNLVENRFSKVAWSSWATSNTRFCL